MIDEQEIDKVPDLPNGFILRANEAVATFIRQKIREKPLVEQVEDEEDSEGSTEVLLNDLNFQVIRIDGKVRWYGLIMNTVMFHCTL